MGSSGSTIRNHGRHTSSSSRSRRQRRNALETSDRSEAIDRGDRLQLHARFHHMEPVAEEEERARDVEDDLESELRRRLRRRIEAEDTVAHSMRLVRAFMEQSYPEFLEGMLVSYHVCARPSYVNNARSCTL